ncbi:hypothetical protein [Bradyrhizobium glycinis]|uniref:hypothetical protein n=1 Tax=Bradyrhizobium glycinis TaxID=2751812 RepID=UPI0018D5C055|nr:hypothetical protein [Bradyrhizobium glycinis]MBH5370504.1 hypothetical protein [Bradyrhizobium glycinis]
MKGINYPVISEVKYGVVTHYNHVRCDVSIGKLTPANACVDRAKAILVEGKRIKRDAIANRRLQRNGALTL